jgi:trehalose 6-phosphate synthase/phosphatase
MRQVRGRVPASHIEEKPLGVAWHYRAADPVMSSWQARELYQHLTEVLSGQGLEVLSGNRVIEVRPAGVSKARAASTVLARRAEPPDFIAAFGDDVTDESLFRELPEDALTVLVGARDTAARHRLEDPSAVRALLARWRARRARSAS